MGLFGALNTAVAGMRAQSFALGNVSGNIANSQTTGYKRLDTSFEDMVSGGSDPDQQQSGSVNASSDATNTVQGDVQAASVSTYMAINGSGFFVVQQPDSQSSTDQPTFSGADLYTRRGDFEVDSNGYLVNGAGYYLMGVPIDPSTGNPASSSPQVLKFENGYMPAEATTEIDYSANLASVPQTNDASSSVPGSELLDRSKFTANPVVGAPAGAKIIGSGGTLSPDAAALVTGTVDLSSFTSAGGTLSINGKAIAIAAGATAANVVTDINGTAGTGVTAALDSSGHLTLTSADADTNITIDGTSDASILSELGLAAGTTNATNLLTQGTVAAGQTLTFQVGGNPQLTVTFGTGAGQVSTLAELNAQLATLTGGTASVDANNGNITVDASNTTDTIAVGGTATASSFGINTLSAIPPNGSVIADDADTFVNESISGGSVTAYDVGGTPVNVQLRWAKVDSASLGAGHSDTWNLFYQSDANATGTQPAWQNAGVNYTFNANGQLSPPMNAITLSNVTVNGVSLGNITLNHGSGGITQFADSHGDVQVNMLQANGFSAGSLQSIAVGDNGLIVGTFSNGRTASLAQVTLANFSGANQLERLDGGAFAETQGSGAPMFNADGVIKGSSLESSNVDIADEFTKLIVTQQAYSANTRVITTTNQMVQDLLNVLR